MDSTELMHWLSKVTQQRNEAMDRETALKREVARLKLELSWYADKHNHYPWNIHLDFGKRAQKALAP